MRSLAKEALSAAINRDIVFNEPWTPEALKEAQDFLSRPVDKKHAQQTQKRTRTKTFERTDLHCPVRAGMTPHGMAAKVWRECCTRAWLHRTRIERQFPPSVEADEEEDDDQPRAMLDDDQEEPLDLGLGEIATMTGRIRECEVIAQNGQGEKTRQEQQQQQQQKEQEQQIQGTRVVTRNSKQGKKRKR